MMDVNKKNTLCVYAHGGICMSTDGMNKPCCSILTPRNNQPPMWNENHGETDWWKSLRNNLANGVNDQRCDKCWDQEAAGMKSMRLGSNWQLENSICDHIFVNIRWMSWALISFAAERIWSLKVI